MTSVPDHPAKDPFSGAAARRALARADTEIAAASKREGARAAARDSRPGAGPVLLGLFMFGMLLHCLASIYSQTHDFWGQVRLTSLKEALVHDYADRTPTVLPLAPAAAQAAVYAMPDDAWHRVADKGDIDDLRAALRLVYAGHNAHGAAGWRSDATGHRGTVTPAGLQQDAAGCRPFRITRQEGGRVLEDMVDFCRDGSIREMRR